MQANALALEYQRDYRSAFRYVDITDVVDKPLVKGEGRVFGPGFSEEILSLSAVQFGTFDKDVPDPALVTKQPV